MTIDMIVREVTDELSNTQEGQALVDNMDKLVARLNSAAPALRRERSKFRARPRISFSLNTTQAKSDRLRISVRVQGVDCGSVVVEQAYRVFKPCRNKNFKKYWKSARPTLEWSAKHVADFLVSCADEARKRYAQRESSVQEQLFQLMSGGRSKKVHLHGFRPVLFAGVPIQIPSPFAPRRVQDGLGKHMGHIDVLARSLPPGRLVVFEVKRPAASKTECEEALAQAVSYAAALDHLMGRRGHRADYWRLFETNRRPEHLPFFSAVAFLDESARQKWGHALSEKRDELLSGNKKNYRLSVMFYRQGIDGIQVIPAAE